MTMLKGYTIPSPGPTDGEYGGFAGYAASPAGRSYWEGQGVANHVPALNGFGDDEPAPMGVPLSMTPVLAGALLGWWLSGWKGAAVGIAAGAYMRKLPVFSGFGSINTLPVKVVGSTSGPGANFNRRKKKATNGYGTAFGLDTSSEYPSYVAPVAPMSTGTPCVGSECPPEGARLPPGVLPHMVGATEGNTGKIVIGVLSLAAVLKLAKVW